MEPTLQPSDRPFQFPCLGLADHKNINVTDRILLVSGERAIEVGLLDSRDLLDSATKLAHYANGLENDAAQFFVKRVGAIEPKVFLTSSQFGNEKSLAFLPGQFPGQISRVRMQKLGQLAQVMARAGVGKVIGQKVPTKF